MFFDERNSDKYYVSAGALDGKISLPKAHHVFVGSKASWYDIDDNLKQHLAYPSSYDDMR
tara:strand:- start:1273 stop:1452 length:180 start_codon:yes stop_codon:yes gene_type:complete